MRFGAFVAPFHTQRNQNPNLALYRDLEITKLLDQLGYDEVWFGEHHSAGAEMITSPEVFCAWVAGQTQRIKVGAGVISLPYHNPLWVADRVALLDHLTRGRFLLGIGPGVLPTDATMIGLDPDGLRGLLQEDLPVLLHLLRSEEPLSVSTDRYELHDARMQLGLYSDLEIALTSMRSPNGPELAGRYGLGLLQLTGLERDGLAILGEHVRTQQAAAAANGQPFDRSALRVVGNLHLAETKDQAIADLAYGLDEYFDYTQHALGGSKVAGSTFESRLEWTLASGHAYVGTPDEAIERIEEVAELAGGIGAFILWAHEWASPEASRRSFELFARKVMPAFQHSARRIESSRDWAAADRLERAARNAPAHPAHAPASETEGGAELVSR